MYLSKDKTKTITGISAIENFDNNLKKCKKERDSTIDTKLKKNTDKKNGKDMHF